jgi:hypothetical protein
VSIVIFKEWLFHVTTNSSKFSFRSISKYRCELNACAKRHELLLRQAFTVPENLSVTLPAGAATFNFYGVGDA